MKPFAINLTFASIIGCLLLSIPVRADTPVEEIEEAKKAATISTHKGKKLDLSTFFVEVNSEKQLHIQNLYDRSRLSNKIYNASFENSLGEFDLTANQSWRQGKAPFFHQTQQADYIFGSHSTFWNRENRGKYWGFTLVERWGITSDQERNLKPQIRAVDFSSWAGQLPLGASALIISGGSSQQFLQESNLLEEFNDFRGGIAYRRGISSDLTLGVGIVYDYSVLGLAQLFYQPSGFPLQVSVSALAGKEGLDFKTSIRYQPSQVFSLDFRSDRYSQQLNLKWQVFSDFTFISQVTNRNQTLAAGVGFSFTNEDLFIAASAELETNNNWRWSFNSRFGRLQFYHWGNHNSTRTELDYFLFGNSTLNTGHSLRISYETRKLNDSNESLATFAWRYHLEPNWELVLGYAIGSQGSGIVTSASTTVIPGLDLRVSYEKVSLTSNNDAFKFELVSK